jgi:glyoxylase-like metal-dependent hydrolase (beta-lactamase superfamily II)
VRPLGDGVYAVVRSEPFGLANHSNNVFIVGPRDVVVVDAPFTLAAARDVIAAIRAVTDRPVRWVIHTHWHDDHVFGNAAYRDTFPGVTIVAQERTREDLATIGAENRRRQVEGGPAAIAEIEQAADRDTAFDGAAMDAPERAAYRSSAAIARVYVAEAGQAAPVLPTLTFGDRLTIDQDGRPIEVRALPGNTRGDAVVWLPRERVLVAGDLVNGGAPSAAHAAPGAWVAALDSLRALDPRFVVPGHGPVEDGTARIGVLRDALADLTAQVAAGVARGEILEQVRAGVKLDALRARVADDSRMGRFFFDGWFAGPAIAAAFREASAAPR